MNFWDILILALVLIAVIFAVRKCVLNHKNGGCSCSGGCSKCGCCSGGGKSTRKA